MLVATTERIFLDSNVIVYALSEDRRTSIAEELIASPFEISVQILNEAINVARRKLRLDWPDIDFALHRVTRAAMMVHDLTAERQRDGVRIARRYKLGIHDAAIAATALSAGCTTLLSEDMHDGLVIDGRLKIRNPFNGDQ